MSEEQTEQSEQSEVTEQVQEAPKAPQASPLFKALYEAAEEPEVSEETVEPEEPKIEPHTLSEALDILGEEPEEEYVEEDVEPESDPVTESSEPEKAKAKKKKVKQVIDPDVPREEQQQAPAFSQQDQVDPDEEYVKTLLPEEREVYELAKFADKNMPEYKGAAQDCKDYFEKSRRYIEKRLKEDPHVDLRNDEEYKTFIARNKPRFSQQDAKKVEREMVIAEAEKRATERAGAENRRLQHEIERMKKAPVVEQTKLKVRQVLPDLMPEEYRENLKSEEGIRQLAEENPFEFQIMDNVAAQLQSVSDTFIDITSGSVSYNPSDPVHKRLLDWVNEEQDAFINSGQTHQDGKVFMRRERYHQLPENKRSEYYTWSDDDLLGLLAARAHQRINTDLANHRQGLERAGYVRQGQPGKVAQPVANQAPPRATSAPRPGGVPAQKVSTKGNPMLNILGM